MFTNRRPLHTCYIAPCSCHQILSPQTLTMSSRQRPFGLTTLQPPTRTIRVLSPILQITIPAPLTRHLKPGSKRRKRRSPTPVFVTSRSPSPLCEPSPSTSSSRPISPQPVQDSPPTTEQSDSSHLSTPPESRNASPEP